MRDLVDYCDLLLVKKIMMLVKITKKNTKRSVKYNTEEEMVNIKHKKIEN